VKTLLTIALAAFSATAFAQPAVLRAVAPEPAKSMELFPGNAIVEVWIDSRGLVIDEMVLKPLTSDAVIEAAARQWMFEPEAGAGCRFAKLNFRIVRRDSREPTHWEPSSQPDPYSITMTFVRSTVWYLTRVNGVVEAERCPLHGDEMSTTEIVPMSYGLPSSSPWSKAEAAYWRAHARSFPTVRHWVLGGCLVSLQTEAEVLVCVHCLAAEAEWLRRHPSFHQ
jgi:hypothetical protein